MRVAIFGLGYVGTVTAASLAARGHQVIGVDSLESKVDAVNRGEPPVIEPGLAELLAKEVSGRRLSATVDPFQAVSESDLCLVCVGTPSNRNGSLGSDSLVRVASTIGAAIAEKSTRYTVVVRSTVIPGTTEQMVIPELEKSSGLLAGDDFGVAVNPEFLREGSSLADFNNPAKTVIGALDSESADALRVLYQDAAPEPIVISIRSAELSKYMDDAGSAVKIAFANEMGAYCRSTGVDTTEVIESFLADTKLNISAAYLTPGFAFGGSCLPKDLRALTYDAKRKDLSLPLLESVLPSNDECVRRVIEVVESMGRPRIGLFGLAFKTLTDDLRESPFVELAERLLGKGYELRIYDPVVSPANLVGTNRSYVLDRIPHLSALMCDSPDEVAEASGLCIVGTADRDVLLAVEGTGKPVIDLCRLGETQLTKAEKYVGSGW